MLILFIYYSYCVLIFHFSILGLIFIDEFLAVVFGTKTGFVSIIVSCLYLDNLLLDYFRNLCFFHFSLIITIINYSCNYAIHTHTLQIRWHIYYFWLFNIILFVTVLWHFVREIYSAQGFKYGILHYTQYCEDICVRIKIYKKRWDTPFP